MQTPPLFVQTIDCEILQPGDLRSDPAPDRCSFITRVRRYSGPDWTGVQTLRG